MTGISNKLCLSMCVCMCVTLFGLYKEKINKSFEPEKLRRSAICGVLLRGTAIVRTRKHFPAMGFSLYVSRFLLVVYIIEWVVVCFLLRCGAVESWGIIISGHFLKMI